MRARARRRLVGALVLLALGVATFPIVFETQPRPIGMETPISVAQRDGTAPAPAKPAAPGPVPLSVLPADAATAQPEPAASIEPLRAAVPAPSAAVPAPLATAPVVAPPPPPAAAVAAPQAGPAPALPPPVAASRPAPALPPTQPEPASTPDTGRFVVQVGAFGEERALREARQRVEKLGLKTYTQVIENDSGRRTRVRVGPFDTRAEAEAAASRVKAGGMPANILAL